MLWSQQRPRRRVTVSWDKHLYIHFTGFADVGDGRFIVPEWWLPAFARRLRIPVADPIGGLRAQVSTLEACERLRTQLWKIDWVLNTDRLERERALIDTRLAKVPPVYPGRRPAQDLRFAILRREIQRSFEGQDEFLSAMQDAYLAASAQVAVVPRSQLVPDMCIWAYPEIGIDEVWTDADWDDEGSLPSPDEDRALQLLRIDDGPGIWMGAWAHSFHIGTRDHWFLDGNFPLGSRPATEQGRLRELQRLTVDLGDYRPDEMKIPHRLVERYERWIDERYETESC